MIMDRTLLFSDGQAITATAVSTNVVDLGATGTPYGGTALVRELGYGNEVEMVCTVTQSFNTLTSLTITIETDDNAGFASATTVWTSPAYTLAQLATGAKYLLPDRIPAGVNERYMRLRYTVGGSNPTLGKITAGVVAAHQSA
jgi:hypothetical protein